MKTTALKAVLLGLASLTLVTPAKADQFTLFIYETKADFAARTDKDKSAGYWGAYNAFAKALAEAGILRGGTALPGNTGVLSASTQGGKIVETTSPVASSELELGGYFVVETPDIATALEWAKKAPGIAAGAVQVVKHYPNPTMPAK